MRNLLGWLVVIGLGVLWVWRMRARVAPSAPPSQALPLDRVYEIVNAYGAALESRRAMLLPDTLLPAPRDEIKRALIIAAALSAKAGQPQDVEKLRTGYILLANFLPPADAAAGTALDDLVAQAAKSPGYDTVTLAKKMATVDSDYAQQIRERSVAESKRLLEEFDAALGALQQAAPAATTRSAS